jgi:hypothetical protein
MSIDPTGSDMARLAILPFQVLQAHGLPNAYERSFKMTNGRLLANRYLLGVPGERPSRATAASIARALGMPESLREPFLDELEDADGILLGFEAGTEAATLKLYLEYRPADDQPASGPASVLMHSTGVSTEASTEGRLLHKGFKWCVGSDVQARVTLYREREITKAQDVVRHFAHLGLHPATLDVLRAALLQNSHQYPVSGLRLSEVSDNTTPRLGLDLNVYAAGLSVASIEPALRGAAQDLNIEMAAFDRLMQLARPALLGHLAAGLDADGRDYLSVYFEP